jgi:hypothetical protein
VPCIKILGPKAEAQICLSRPISMYDPSIPSEDVSCLHYLYSNDTGILCGSVKLDVLARVLARVYSPSIADPGLRHIIIALFMAKSRLRTTSTCPTDSEQQHVDIAFAELKQKLSYPDEVNECNVFIAYMLAMWSRNIDAKAVEAHIEGVVAIMGHLSKKLGNTFSTSPMAPFWALLRDESLWLTRKSENCHRLCQKFRDILGPKTILQRQRYENELRSAMVPDLRIPNAKVFFGRAMYTSVHTMIESAKIINQRHSLQSSAQDPLIESIVVELRVEQRLVEKKNHEPPLESELRPLETGGYVKDWHVELTVIERIHDLMVLNVCRLATIALEAVSIQQGFRSPEGIAASTSLISVLRRARQFFMAGIKDGRAFGTGTYARTLVLEITNICPS